MNHWQKISQALKNPRRILAFFQKKIKSSGINKHNNYRKFIILSRSRTGSNLLLSYLNTHPNIIADHEIFQRPGKKPFQSTLNHQFRKYPKPIKAVGFKIFYNHPLREVNQDLWNTLRGMKDLHIIHLKRRNILRTLLSLQLALQSDKWVNYASKNEMNRQKKAIPLEVDFLEKGFIQTRQWEQQGDEMFKDHPIITIFYEDLVEQPEQTLKQITDFLDVERSETSTYLQRQNPEKASDLIENYEELTQYFSGSIWESFFLE